MGGRHGNVFDNASDRTDRWTAGQLWRGQEASVAASAFVLGSPRRSVGGPSTQQPQVQGYPACGWPTMPLWRAPHSACIAGPPPIDRVWRDDLTPQFPAQRKRRPGDVLVPPLLGHVLLLQAQAN